MQTFHKKTVVQHFNTSILQYLGVSLFFSFFLFCLPTTYSAAHCTVSYNDSGSMGSGVIDNGHRQGQSFIACATGTITSISLPVNTGTATASGHELRIAAGTTTSALTSPVLATFNTAGGAETITIPLPTPFPVIGGQTYTLEYQSAATNIVVVGCNACDYPDGNRYFAIPGGAFVSQPAFDMIFSVTIATAPSSIPTLSEWGLIILALLLMTFGTLYLINSQFSLPKKTININD